MFGRALISLSLSLSQLSVWLEHGSGSSYRGCFWSLVTTILQMLLALAISLYSDGAEDLSRTSTGSDNNVAKQEQRYPELSGT